MLCEFCNYEWENRKDKPKACPRCKRRFDYPKTKNKEEGKQNVRINGRES